MSDYSVSNTKTGFNNTSWGRGSKKGDLGAAAEILENSTIPELKNITTARALQEYLRDEAGYTGLQVDERVGNQTLDALKDWINYNKRNNPNNIDGVRFHSVDESGKSNPTLQFTSGTTNVGSPINIGSPINKPVTSGLSQWKYMTADTDGTGNFNQNYFKSQQANYRNVNELYDYVTKKVAANDYSDPVVRYFAQYDPNLFAGNTLNGREGFTNILSQYGIHNRLGRQDRRQLADFINNGLRVRSEIMNLARNFAQNKTSNNWNALINAYNKYGMKDINTYLPTTEELSEEMIPYKDKFTAGNDGYWHYYLKNGGTLKFQQGGELNEMQQQFMSYLMEKYQIKTSSELNALVKQLASTQTENGVTQLEEEQQEFMQELQNQQTLTMKNGAKINYLKKLRGMCPEGYETTYYKVGGQICSKCAKKAEKGASAPKKEAFFEKCGNKIKKKACGGKSPKACNGKKF